MAAWPLTCSEAEQSFSGLRRLKNYMRLMMKEDRLNDLTLMIVHRSICVNSRTSLTHLQQGILEEFDWNLHYT